MARSIKVKCIETGELFSSCRSAARWLLSTGQIKPHRDPMKFKNPCLRNPKYATYGESAISRMIQDAAITQDEYNGYHWELDSEYKEWVEEVYKVLKEEKWLTWSN